MGKREIDANYRAGLARAEEIAASVFEAMTREWPGENAIVLWAAATIVRENVAQYLATRGGWDRGAVTDALEAQFNLVAERRTN